MSDRFDRKSAPSAASFHAMGQSVTEGAQTTAELRQEVDALRRVLTRIIWCQLRGEPLALHEDPLRTWLGLPLDATPEQALERLARSQAKVIGTTACPTCGAQIQDKEGITNESCPWCGATLE